MNPLYSNSPAQALGLTALFSAAVLMTIGAADNDPEISVLAGRFAFALWLAMLIAGALMGKGMW